MPFFIFKIFSLLTGINRCYNSAMAGENLPTPAKAEDDDKPFFKKLRFWVHIFTTVAFLIAGQYRTYLKKQEEGSSPVAHTPVIVDPPPGSPTVWSLQVQANADHETLKSEIQDRKELATNVEEYRKENHDDLSALGDEVKGLRKDVQSLIELVRSQPRTVSVMDKLNSKEK